LPYASFVGVDIHFGVFTAEAIVVAVGTVSEGGVVAAAVVCVVVLGIVLVVLVVVLVVLLVLLVELVLVVVDSVD